jgi:hypothetical protein
VLFLAGLLVPYSTCFAPAWYGIRQQQQQTASLEAA